MKIRILLASLGFATICWSDSSFAQPDFAQSEAILKMVALHAAVHLSDDQVKKAKTLSISPELDALSQRFRSEVLTDTDYDSLGYTMHINRYNWNGERTSLNEPIWSSWADEKIEPSKYFVFPKVKRGGLAPNNNGRNWHFIAPLRMEDDLIVFLASSGPDSLGEAGSTFEAQFAYVVGVKLDSVDEPEKMSLADVLSYYLRLETLSLAKLNEAFFSELKRYPDMSKLHRYYSQMGMSKSLKRLKFNFSNRDLRGEVSDFVKKARSAPGVDMAMEKKLADGGVGLLKTKDGSQYFLQTVFSGYNSVISNDVEFVRALMDPNLKIEKKIMLPMSLPAAKAALDKLRDQRAKKEKETALEKYLSKAMQAQEQVADKVYGDFMAKMKVGPKPNSCDENLE